MLSTQNKEFPFAKPDKYFQIEMFAIEAASNKKKIWAAFHNSNKYLGITTDKKISWNQHLSSTVRLKKSYTF